MIIAPLWYVREMKSKKFSLLPRESNPPFRLHSGELKSPNCDRGDTVLPTVGQG